LIFFTHYITIILLILSMIIVLVPLKLQKRIPKKILTDISDR
jgi:hypothetical protein